MSAINIINQFTIDAGIATDILQSANKILTVYDNSCTLVELSHCERYSEWWRADNNQLVLPLPYEIGANILSIDYDGICSEPAIIGDCFFGSDSLDKTIIAVKNNDYSTTICDAMASSFLFVCKEEPDIAYAMMQSLYGLLALHDTLNISKAMSPKSDWRITPYGI